MNVRILWRTNQPPREADARPGKIRGIKNSDAECGAADNLTELKAALQQCEHLLFRAVEAKASSAREWTELVAPQCEEQRFSTEIFRFGRKQEDRARHGCE
jgi:hypothetical protein